MKSKGNAKKEPKKAKLALEKRTIRHLRVRTNIHTGPGTDRSCIIHQGYTTCL